MSATEVIQKLDKMFESDKGAGYLGRGEVQELRIYIADLKQIATDLRTDAAGQDATIVSLQQSVERLQQFQRNTRAVYENTIQCIIEALVDRR